MNTTDNGNILLMFEEINQKLERVGQWIDKIEQSQSANNADTNQDLINEISQLKSELDVFIKYTTRIWMSWRTGTDPPKGGKSNSQSLPCPRWLLFFIDGYTVIACDMDQVFKNELYDYSDNDLKFRYI